jgi:transcriptional regulator GlxA family with amidase domain
MSREQQASDHRLIAQVDAYAQRCLTAGSSPRPAECATALRLDQAVLTRYVVLATGHTLGEYLNRFRFEFAKMLLRTTNISIEEVAQRTGYETKAAFTRIFRCSSSFSPSGYRRFHRQRKEGLP